MQGTARMAASRGLQALVKFQASSLRSSAPSSPRKGEAFVAGGAKLAMRRIVSGPRRMNGRDAAGPSSFEARCAAQGAARLAPQDHGDGVALVVILTRHFAAPLS